MEYYERLTPAQFGAIEAISMDMWEPFYLATVETVPLAKDKIVFDRFHIAQPVNKAVDKVRREENRTLKAEGIALLKGTKYLWLYSEKNLPEKRKESFESLKAVNLKTGRAWSIKEMLGELWEAPSVEAGREFFQRWFGGARRSQLEPIKTVALTVKNHLEGILNYLRHRVTNGVAEGMNSKIQTVRRNARGHRNTENLKTAIMFFCGRLELHPH
ncbi:MAG: hypothetical protein GKR94_32120 [Gammaproteobacteria bacterium]|nr:hypothetical protein [Gammaproteobacteria bacterium]